LDASLKERFLKGYFPIRCSLGNFRKLLLALGAFGW
jgi:hypothetical protein